MAYYLVSDGSKPETYAKEKNMPREATVVLGYRIPESLRKRLKRHRKTTGIPSTVFVRRLIEAALDQEQNASRRNAG